MNNQSLHILVVDVDSTSFLLLKIALEEVRKTEVALTHATRLDEALRCLHDNHFDAVLLHLNLPDSQGLETFVTMQREHPAMPILILSGRDDEDTAIQAVQCGAQDFVAKGHIAGIPLVRSIRYAMERKRAEQRLIASEAGYRRLFETAHDGIFILDAATGQITDANPYLEEMLGYTISEFIGKRLWEIAPFRDKAANQAAFRTLQEKSYIRYDDLPLLTKDGKRTSVEFVSNVYEVGDQRVIQCNIRDITERKQAAEAERESKRFLQATLDALSSHIAVLDESGQIIAVNRTWRKFSEENQATPVSSGVGANYLAVCERARGIWSEEALAVAQGIRDVMAGKHEAFCVEYPCHSPSEERWFKVCVTRFAGDGPIRVAIAHENITQSKLVEETLSQSKWNLAKSQQMAHLGSWELDLSNLNDINVNPLHWSDELYRIFGYKPGQIEISNEAFFSAVHPEDRPKINRVMEEALRGGKPYSVEHRIVLPDGTERIVQAKAEILYSEETGQPIKMVGLGQDITERKHTEANSARLASIVESSDDAIISKTLDSIITSWNSGAEALYGYSRQEAIGRSAAVLIAPNRPDEEAQLIGRVVQGEHVAQYETERVCKDGRHLDVSLTLSPIKNEAGEIIGVSTIARDISDRKQAEIVLQEQSQISELSFDAVLVWTWNGAITFWNAGAEALYGFPREEAIGRVSHELLKTVHPQGQEAFLQLLETEGQCEVEVLHTKSNGQQIVVETRHKLIRGATGAYVIETNRDITERQQTEKALHRSESLFRALVQNSWNGFQLVQPDGKITYESPTSARLLGYSVEEMEGHNAFEFVHPDDAQEMMEEGQSFLESPGKTRTILLRIRHKNGSWRWVESYEINLLNHPDVGAIAVNYHDITERKEAEEERDRFFTLSLDMLSIIGSDGYFKRLNPAFETTLGFSNAELMAVPFLEFVHSDDIAATLGAIAVLENGAQVIDFENRYRCRDGSYKWLRWMAAPYEDLWYCAAHDITGVKQAATALLKANNELELHVMERTAELHLTNEQLHGEMIERKNADAALYKNHEFLEAVLENTTEGIVACDAEGQLTFFNRATRDFHGLPLEALLPAQWAQYYSLYLPDGLTPMPMEEVPLFKTLNGNPSRDTEMVIAPNEGTPRLLIANGELLFDADGAKLGAVVVMHDITQRKQAEVELQRSQQELQNLIDAMTTLAAKVAPDGTFLIVNKIAIDASGLSREEYMKTNFLSGPWWAFDPEVQQRVGEKFQQALAGTLINYEEKIFVFGQQRVINLSLIPMHNGGNKVEYLVAEGRDITDLKHTETALQEAKTEAERANHAKSEFLSRMSHELRTPLNAILGFGQILDKEDLDPLSQESVGYILKGGRHLLDLINEVLDIARVEAGHADLSLEPIALDEVLIDACALVRPLAAERHIRLLGNTVELGGIHVLADRQRFKQVLINLLSNAIKYNREGGQVEIACEAKPDGRMAIAVCDTGPGIAPQDLTKLFTPFERLNAGASNVEGTGLGLVLSQRLVTAMGGTLKVESVLGRGTTFTIELPQALSPVERFAALPESPALVETKRESERTYSILCIEDNASNLRLIEAILRSRPEIALLSAMQGSVGLDLARQHEPDLILLDLNLPDIHGSEVLTRLQQSALTRDIPVVVISADATPKQIEKLKSAGAKDYLTKPLDVQQFLHTLDKFLREVPTTEI